MSRKTMFFHEYDYEMIRKAYVEYNNASYKKRESSRNVYWASAKK